MQALSSSTQFGITVLRISLGLMWIAHALLKLFVFTLPGTAQCSQRPHVQDALMAEGLIR